MNFTEKLRELAGKLIISDYDCLARIDLELLAGALAEARLAALKDAIAQCESPSMTYEDNPQLAYKEGRSDCAEEIRALERTTTEGMVR